MPDGWETRFWSGGHNDYFDPDSTLLARPNEDWESILGGKPNDGVRNIIESQHRTNPLDNDSDGDGLTDYYEIHYGGCSEPSYPNTYAPDVVGYYKMDDNAANTTVEDSSTYGNDGAAQRNTSILNTTGYIDDALNFNGTSDYINLGNPAEMQFGTDVDFTFSLWIQTSMNSEGRLIDNKESSDGKGIRLHFSSNGQKVEGQIKDAEGDLVNFYGLTTVNDNDWHHIALVADRTGNCILYVDAVQEASVDMQFIGDITTTVGFKLGGDTAYFDGKMDNVLVFTRAVSHNAVRALSSLTGGTDYNGEPRESEGCTKVDDDGNPIFPCGTGTNPTGYDDDGDGVPDGRDTDDDGLSDGEEINVTGTCPLWFDTDGDYLPDDWEIDHGLNPNDATGINGQFGDFDGDGTNNFDELIHGTNPNDPGSNPPALIDSGKEYIDVRLTVGDHSDSHSERYNLVLECIDCSPAHKITHQAPNFGEVEEAVYPLEAGQKYEVKIIHKGSKGNSPDYDYIALVEVENPEDEQMMVIDDPDGILGEHFESNPFYARGKTASVTILHPIDLDIEGVVEDSEENPGGYLPANIDDDDNNGILDKDDSGTVTGENDLIEISLSGPFLSLNTGTVKLEISAGMCNIWENSTKGSKVTLPKTWDVSSESVPSTLYVEGKELKDSVTEVRLRLSYINNEPIFNDDVKFSVTPYLLIPNTATAKAIYVSNSFPDFVSDLTTALSGTELTPQQATGHTGIWLQDQVEIGYSSWPSNSSMWLVWDLPKNANLSGWPLGSLFGPDIGYFKKVASSLESYDFGGNLEVSPPVTVQGNEYKIGRAVVGTNSMLSNFVNDQGVQSPIVCDTSWLLVGHIDEVITFVPYGSTFKVLIADTTSAVNLLQSMNIDDGGVASSGTSTTLTDTTKGWPINYWAGGFVEITAGAGAGQVRQISSNTSNTITVSRPWDSPLADSSEYRVVVRSAYRAMFYEGDEDCGAATNGTSNTLTDSTKSWPPSKWAGGYIKIIEGTGAAQTRKITSSSANTITIDGSWSVNPDSTSRYVLVQTSKIWNGGPAVRCVRGILGNSTLISFQSFCQSNINDVRSQLSAALGNPNFVDIPALFFDSDPDPFIEKALAYMPGMVNMLVVGDVVIVPDPFGPKNPATDIFKNDVSTKLGNIGLAVGYVDDWCYHVLDGEIHCATNVKRTPPSTNWWE